MSPRVWGRLLLAVLAITGLVGLWAFGQGAPALTITSPLEGAVFPRDFAPPTLRWQDSSGASRWRVRVELPDSTIEEEQSRREWRPSASTWERIKKASIGRVVRLEVTGLSEAVVVSRSWRSIQTSPDPVDAAVFFREVPLPVGLAMDHKPLIAWKLGWVSSPEPPRVVLSGMKTCANCHSFSADGRTLGMDIDFGPDKGSYAIAEVDREVRIGRSEVMSWNDYRREDGLSTFGLLSALSPDGKRAVSTVREAIVLSFMPDLNCSQLFFPFKGILAVYEREGRTFRALAGADDPAFVQTNPTFSPDGRTVVFARAPVPAIAHTGVVVEEGQSQAVVAEFNDGRRKIRYDLYRVPIGGGAPRPVPGASANERSNFFPRYSPDGRWIVFCQADSMMLNRPDSELFILPAEGGTPRRLRCNAPGRMNSWHSFSPNGRWLVYASKAAGPYTQLWMTHIDDAGQDTTPVMLEGFVAADRAANLPEFVKLAPEQLESIQVAAEIRDSTSKLPARPRPATGGSGR